jgi:hypothetical protein
VTGQSSDGANNNASVISGDTTQYPSALNSTTHGPNFSGGSFTAAPGQSIASVQWVPSSGLSDQAGTWTVAGTPPAAAPAAPVPAPPQAPAPSQQAPHCALSTLARPSGACSRSRGSARSLLSWSRSAGRYGPDALPSHARRLGAEIAERYGPDRTLAEVSQAWRPYRTWAAVHLRALQEQRTGEIAGR